jgi:hypothetical protein
MSRESCGVPIKYINGAAGAFQLGQCHGGCGGNASLGRSEPLEFAQGKPGPTTTGGDNCCDSRHMKAGGPEIWFYRLAGTTGDTARTVGFDRRNCMSMTEWNETLPVCI